MICKWKNPPKLCSDLQNLESHKFRSDCSICRHLPDAFKEVFEVEGGKIGDCSLLQEFCVYEKASVHSRVEVIGVVSAVAGTTMRWLS